MILKAWGVVSEADIHVFPMRPRNSLADVLSIQRARNGQGDDLDVAVEHLGVVRETTGIGMSSDSEVKVKVGHLLRIRWEMDSATYGS